MQNRLSHWCGQWPLPTSLALVMAALLILALNLMAQTAVYATGSTIYVDASASSGGDGTTWGSAYTDLQTALTNAVSGDEIWVASGVYTPGIDVNATYTVTSGIQLYGGFIATETLRTQRDWIANPTILSGDIDGNDITVSNVITTAANIVGNNAYHVLVLDGVNGDPITQTTRIDGFTITAGNASGGLGGGLTCQGYEGGECSPVIANATFSGNRAGSGGAMYNAGYPGGKSNPSLVDVTFTGNAADNGGGAMFNNGKGSGASSPSLVNVTFSGNWSVRDGGAMYNSGYTGGASNPSLVDVTFTGNWAGWNGGAMFNGSTYSGVSSPSLVDVTFTGNIAGGDGGAMLNNGEDSGVSSPSLTNVTFTSNVAAEGGAMFNGGRMGQSSPSLVNVTFTGNQAGAGGAMYNNGADSGTSSPSLANVTFTGNAADYGGAMYNQGDDGASVVHLANVILWDNTATYDGDQLYNYFATSDIRYTLIASTAESINDDYDGTTTWGPANITNVSAYTTTDIFVDAANGILRLVASSPAVDVGSNSRVPAGTTTDLTGRARIFNGTVDLGAYEYMPDPLLTIAKFVTPASDVAYQGVVTYTVVLSNTGGSEDNTVSLTDTLPDAVDFAYWIDQSGATVANDKITWNGTVTVSQVITISFAVTSTASSGAIITNTASFSGMAQADSDQAAFTATADAYPTGSGNWSQVFGACASGCKRVIPAGVTVTLDGDMDLDGDFEIEPGATFIANGHTVTLTGGAAQTLTGAFSFYRLTLNKDNASDTVTIDGTLEVTSKLRIRKGKLISASDYEDVDIDTDGTLVLTKDITIGGNLSITGTLTTDGHGITFDGGKTQNLALYNYTNFDDLTVYTDTLLIETASDDNLGLGGTLTNYGTIRKSQPVSGADFYYFGLAGNYPDPSAYGMEIEVTDLLDSDPLTAIQVDRIDKLHPNAPVGTGEAIYWSITPTGGGFTATVTLPYTNTNTPLACRYTGSTWDCGNDDSVGDPDWIVSRHDVTAFSDWAVLDCSPSATVSDTGDSGAGTLRQAIANVCAGGKVDFDLTYPATITLTSGEITIGKALTIAGPGAENMAVSGDNASRIFTSTAASPLTIQGLTLRDGSAAGSGGAIFAAAPLTLTQVAVISNTSSTYGGAVRVMDALVVSGTQFIKNSSQGSDNIISVEDSFNGAGAIYANGDVRLVNSLFQENQALGGNAAGVLYSKNGAVRIVSSQFISNTAAEEGALLIDDDRSSPPALEIVDSLFQDNQATNTDRGAIFAMGPAVIEASQFQGNHAARNVGVGYISGTLTLTDTDFIDNSVDTANDGAMYVKGDAVISGSLFQGNTAHTNRGALCVNGSLTLTDTDFINNSASIASYGAVWADGDAVINGSLFQGNTAATEAGALYVTGSLTLTDTDFISNSASTSLSGAVWALGDAIISGSLFQSNTAGSYTGALLVGGSLTLTDTDFISNNASTSSVGAVSIHGDAVISGSLFRSNTAGSDTGALYVNGSLVVSGTQFIGNTSSGDDNYGMGAGAVYGGGDVTIVNSLFQENKALNGFNAGGLYSYNSVVTITNTDFISNTAGGSYGALFVEAFEGGAPVLSISGGRFQGNEAGDDAGAIGSGGQLVIDSAQFQENQSGGSAGALSASGTVEISGTQFYSNTAVGAGGALAASGPVVDIDLSTFAGNSSSGAEGGAVAVSGGGSDVTVTDSTFTGNTALASGMDGGAIYVADDDSNKLVVERSTFVDNRAYEGGALGSRDLLYVSNSTFYHNQAVGEAGDGGGALHVMDTVYVTNTTIYSNSAPSNGGGMRVSAATGNYNLVNTIVAGNSGGNCSTAGGNINAIVATSDDTSCDPTSYEALDSFALGELGDYGGTTQTLPLLPGSHEIDKGNASYCMETDQRGVARPQLDGCDIGAFESQGFSLTVASGDNQSQLVGLDFVLPLVVTVTSNHSEPVDNGGMTFVGPFSGAGLATPVTFATISGGSATITATANYTEGAYTVMALVNMSNPAVNFTLTNGCANMATVVNTNDNGGGSLRWAVAAVCPGGSIDFASALTAGGAATITLTSGEIVIDKSLTVAGPGAGNLAVSGNNATRVFSVSSGTDVIIDGLTIRDGNLTGSDGAGIRTSGVLTISNSSFIANISSGQGGAIYNDNKLSVFDSQFSNNTSSCEGGAISNMGTLNLYSSDLHDNQVNPDPGCSGIGGAVLTDGHLSVAYSRLHDNNAYGGGAIGIQGDISDSAFVTITHSAIYSNSAEFGGGAIAIAGPSNTQISESNIYSNTAMLVGGIASGYGGATLEIINSTLTGNTTQNGSSAILVADGNIVDGLEGFGPDTLSLTNVTIAGNGDDTDLTYAVIGTNTGFGGPTVVITNTIIAAGPGEGSCIFVDTVVEASHSLDSDGTCATGFTQSDTILLGEFGSHGEGLYPPSMPTSSADDSRIPPPPTLPLLPGSSAIDAGDAAACPATDQRGVSRAGACDIGAFESQGFSVTKGHPPRDEAGNPGWLHLRHPRFPASRHGRDRVGKRRTA